MPHARETTLTPESIARFQKWLSGRVSSQHTIKAYGSDLKMFLKDLGDEDPTPVEIQTELEELGLAWLSKNRRSLAPRTTARRLTSLREFSKYAGYAGMFSEFRTPSPGRAVPHPLPEGMAGVRRMIQVAGDNIKQKAMLALCGMCGLRLHEALALMPDDFDIRSEEEVWLTVRGKGDVTRRIPVNKEAMAHLYEPWLRAKLGGHCVVPMKDRYARRCVTDLGRRAGLSRSVSSHDLRATFATAVWDKTKDKMLIQRLLGHASGATTEIYIETSNGTMLRGVADL